MVKLSKSPTLLSFASLIKWTEKELVHPGGDKQQKAAEPAAFFIRPYPVRFEIGIARQWIHIINTK